MTCIEQTYGENNNISIAEITFKKHIVTIKDLLIYQPITIILNFRKNFGK